MDCGPNFSCYRVYSHILSTVSGNVGFSGNYSCVKVCLSVFVTAHTD